MKPAFLPMAVLAGIAACLWVAVQPHSPRQTIAARASSVPLRSGLAPEDKVSVQLEGADLRQCIAMYAELTGREPWPGKKSALQRFDEAHGYKLSRWGWIKPFSAPNSGIIYHRDGRYSVSEVREYLEAVFKSAGLVPVCEGKWHFRLVGKASVSPGAGVQTLSRA